MSKQIGTTPIDNFRPRAVSFYIHSYGWDCYRAKDVETSIQLAEAMDQACRNPNLKVSNYKTTAIFTQQKIFGSIEAINKECLCDSATLVRACCVQAGISIPIFTTANATNILQASGYFEDPFQVFESTSLYDGDILISREPDLCGIILNSVRRDGKEEDNNTSAVMSKNRKYSGIAKTRCDVRTNSSESSPLISGWPILMKGNRVDICDEKTDEHGRVWYYVRMANRYFGFVLSDFISKGE